MEKTAEEGKSGEREAETNMLRCGIRCRKLNVHNLRWLKKSKESENEKNTDVAVMKETTECDYIWVSWWFYFF